MRYENLTPRKKITRGRLHSWRSGEADVDILQELHEASMEYRASLEGDFALRQEAAQLFERAAAEIERSRGKIVTKEPVQVVE